MKAGGLGLKPIATADQIHSYPDKTARIMLIHRRKCQPFPTVSVIFIW